jgi:hypothetical protein
MDAEVSAEDREELELLVRESNSKLAEAGSESAEQSFGLGCLLGGLLLGGVILVLSLIGFANIILAAILLVIGVIGVTGVAALWASFARTRRISDTYRLHVGPEIERTLKHRDLPHHVFFAIADLVLAEDAPLRLYLGSFATGEPVS